MDHDSMMHRDGPRWIMMDHLRHCGSFPCGQGLGQTSAERGDAVSGACTDLPVESKHLVRLVPHRSHHLHSFASAATCTMWHSLAPFASTRPLATLREKLRFYPSMPYDILRQDSFAEISSTILFEFFRGLTLHRRIWQSS